MKIRNGFVSNSSSSSFLIYGVSFEYDEKWQEDLVEKFNSEQENEKDQVGDFLEMVDVLIEKDDLDLEVFNPDDVEISIGTSWSHVEDDETGAQFKERVRSQIYSILPKEHIGCICTLEEAWQDG